MLKYLSDYFAKYQERTNRGLTRNPWRLGFAFALVIGSSIGQIYAIEAWKEDWSGAILLTWIVVYWFLLIFVTKPLTRRSDAEQREVVAKMNAWHVEMQRILDEYEAGNFDVRIPDLPDH